MEASISLKSISKKINEKTILADLSFGVEKGTRLAIVGANDSGKSTILKLLCGIVYKDKGSIYINGIDSGIHPVETKTITGYMPQEIDFDEELTLIENIAVYGELYGLKTEDSYNNAIKICQKLSINTYIYYKISNVPNSILKIAMFARAIVHDPEILLLDEPTSNLGVQFREVIWTYIDNYCKNKTIVYSTHNCNEAELHSDRIAILHEGTIKYIGNYEYLIENAKGLSQYKIACKKNINENIIKDINLNPKIANPTIKDNFIIFYTVDKNEFYKILKQLIDLDICDLSSTQCTLDDILVKINNSNKE
tara:strand:+ start:64 stop:990 length:927 start_codon:yes stop_codon:yes gene_type:complete